MINSITMAPLNTRDDCSWFHDYCSNLHPVKFMPDRAMLYVDTCLYERICTCHSIPPKLEQLMSSEDYARFSTKLSGMRDGDSISGCYSFLVGESDSRMAYILNCGIVRGMLTITGVLYDVTMIDMLRTQLVSMDNLIMLGQLSAGILHDVGNHIMTVGAIAAVIRDRSSDVKIKEYADDIVQCMEACGQLNNNSKGIAKSKIDKFVRVNVWNLMRRIINMMQGTLKDKYKISIKTYSEYYHILGDEYLLQNAILNIMLNARDAMPDGGSINIQISNEEDMLVLSIKDTGIGMDNNVKAHIFEPFFTTKSNLGTGIGLARCKYTVESHNGTIDVKSAPGKGSEFILRLPLLR